MKISPSMKEELRKFLLKKTREEEEKVTVTVSYKMSKGEIEELQSMIPALKKAELNVILDESLIAGITIQKGSKIVDLSLKGKLQELNRLTYEVA